MLDGLNPEQQEAVLHGEGPLLVFAGAGSGKTRVLTSRIAHLVQERGADPESVLAITFTNKAAREMKERLDGLLGERTKKMWVSTFHSACLRILRSHCAQIGLEPRFSIYDEDDGRKLILNVTEDLNYDPDFLKPAGTQAAIGRHKNSLITPAEAMKLAGDSDRDIRRAHVFAEYQVCLREYNAVDFDDILVHTVDLFKNHPYVLEGYQDQFRWILVDEYQDTNVAQNEIVRLLADKYRNITVVGDDAQSIYAFRGAEVSNILRFNQVFPELRMVVLEQNYRSTKHILDAANAVIANNETQAKKNLWTEQERGAQIVTRIFSSGEEEARWVAGEVVKLTNRGIRGGNIAVLCRQKVIGQGVEKALLAREVPSKFIGGVPFLERKDTKNLLGYLRLVINPHDEIAFRRVVNTPSRALGDVSVKKIRSWAKSRALPLGEAIRRGDEMELAPKATAGIQALVNVIEEGRRVAEAGGAASDVLGSILETTDYREFINRLGGDDAGYKLENIDTLVELAMTYSTVEAFLEMTSLISEQDEVEEDGHRVLIMTIHAAKGLEFPVVFLPAMEESILPDSRCRTEEDIEEERRLAYVAITRSRERLYLTRARWRMKHGQSMENEPSRFLEEIPAHLIIDAALAA
jgi:DNA helicase-2/ATP-dependent DNA helicase PcrA